MEGVMAVLCLECLAIIALEERPRVLVHYRFRSFRNASRVGKERGG